MTGEAGEGNTVDEGPNGPNGPNRWCILTDHNDFEETRKKILDVLDHRDEARIQQLRSNARKFVEDNYDSRVNGNKWRLLVDALT